MIYHVEAVLKFLYLIDVVAGRLKAYTVHAGCWSYLFNLISLILHTT